MKNYESLKKALKEIERWGEENGGHWCREHARQTLASIDEGYDAVRSSDASTVDNNN